MKTITKGLTAAFVATVTGGVLLYGQNCGTSVRHDQTGGAGLSSPTGGTHLVDLDNGGQLPPDVPPIPYPPSGDVGATPAPYPPDDTHSTPPVAVAPSPSPSSGTTTPPVVFIPTPIDPQQSRCLDLSGHLHQLEYANELTMSVISECGFSLVVDSLKDLNADSITSYDVRSNPFYFDNNSYCFFRFGFETTGQRPYLTYWPVGKSTTVPAKQIVTVKYMTTNFATYGTGYRELRILLEAPHQQTNGGWIAPAITCFHPSFERDFTLLELRGLVKNIFKIEVIK